VVLAVAAVKISQLRLLGLQIRVLLVAKLMVLQPLHLLEAVALELWGVTLQITPTPVALPRREDKQVLAVQVSRQL